VPTSVRACKTERARGGDGVSEWVGELCVHTRVYIHVYTISHA